MKKILNILIIAIIVCFIVPQMALAAWWNPLSWNVWHIFTKTQSAKTEIPSSASGCVPNWQCETWSDCARGLQTRNCIDANSCGVSANKPPVAQSCTAVCSPNWKCSGWGACLNSSQTRTCTDSNNCGINSGKPALTKVCSEVAATATTTPPPASNQTCVNLQAEYKPFKEKMSLVMSQSLSVSKEFNNYFGCWGSGNSDFMQLVADASYCYEKVKNGKDSFTTLLQNFKTQVDGLPSLSFTDTSAIKQNFYSGIQSEQDAYNSWLSTLSSLMRVAQLKSQGLDSSYIAADAQRSLKETTDESKVFNNDSIAANNSYASVEKSYNDLVIKNKCQALNVSDADNITNNVKIVCNYGSKKTISGQDSGLTFSKSQFDSNGNFIDYDQNSIIQDVCGITSADVFNGTKYFNVTLVNK